MDRITGDGQNFRTAEDLTDLTHDFILDTYVSELDASGGGIYAALRAIAAVERAAVNHRWSPESVDALGVVAGQMYGQIMAENVLTLHRMKRLLSS